MALETFDRKTVRALAAEAQELLAPLAEKYGITVEVKGGSFSASNFNTKIAFAVEGAKDQEFASLAPLVGLNADDLNRSFTYAGKTYTITGLNLRARQYPVQVTRADGKTFKMSEAHVKQALGR